MKKPLAAIALLCAMAGLAWYFNLFHKPAPAPKSTAAPPPIRTNAAPVPVTNLPAGIDVDETFPALTNETPPVANADLTSQLRPATVYTTPQTAPKGPLIDGMLPFTVLENTRTTVRDYASRFGGNPVGNNLEISKVLAGENPKGVNFIRPDSGVRLNEKGELIDPWGTPLFFHQLSSKEMEIHSAGPDKKMWTADDLIIK
jgi:hypothetical protein